MLSRIKALIPHAWKYPFWWLFKSPQRAFGWQTLGQDLAALSVFIFHIFYRQKKLQRISVCTGTYNRTGMYLDHLLESVLLADHPELIELSVYDCGSGDAAELEHGIRKKWRGQLQFHSEPAKFSRAFAFNRAVAQSTADIIFICDADMSIPADIVRLCNQYTAPRIAWYPIVFYLFRDQPAVISRSTGHWMQFGGKGMLACRKQDFLAIGGIDESFTEWGREDDELWERFVKAGYRIIRNRQRGLLHHWHPSFNPKYKIVN